MPDHIHLFVEADPFDSPTNIVKIFKGVTGLRTSRKFPESKLWRGVMWSPYYYVGTAGNVSAETIESISENSRQSGSVVHPLVKTGSLPTRNSIKGPTTRLYGTTYVKSTIHLSLAVLQLH
jgi:hypothetical protein